MGGTGAEKEGSDKIVGHDYWYNKHVRKLERPLTSSSIPSAPVVSLCVPFKELFKLVVVYFGLFLAQVVVEDLDTLR